MVRNKFWGSGKPHPYDVYRKQIRRFLEMHLAVRQVVAQGAGAFPFNGTWRTEDKIREQLIILRRKDRAMIGDLIVLALATLGFGAALILLIEFLI